jgi:hypothetical protein
MHKTQCDPKLEFFRAAPLSEAEVNALVLIDANNLGIGSYPLTADAVSLREAMTRFGVSRLASVQVRLLFPSLLSSVLTLSSSQSLAIPLSITNTKTLTLEQSKLAFLFRFFLRSYRYPDLFHAVSGRVFEGNTPQTGHTFLAQTVFPFLVNAPDGKPAFRLPPGENEILVYLRDYLDLNLLYTTLSLTSSGYSIKADNGPLSAAEQRQYESLQPLLRVSMFRLNTAWEELVKEGRMHPILEESKASYYCRCVFKCEPEDLPSINNSFYLMKANGLVV